MLQELYESMNAANERLDSMNDKIDMYVESVISSMNAKIYDAELGMLYESVDSYFEASISDVKDAVKDTTSDSKKLSDKTKELRAAIMDAKTSVVATKAALRTLNGNKIKKLCTETEEKMDKVNKLYDELNVLSRSKDISTSGKVYGVLASSIITALLTFASAVIALPAITGSDPIKDFRAAKGLKKAERFYKDKKSMSLSSSEAEMYDRAGTVAGFASVDAMGRVKKGLAVAAGMTAAAGAMGALKAMLRDVRKGEMSPASFNRCIMQTKRQYDSLCREYSKVKAFTKLSAAKESVTFDEIDDNAIYSYEIESYNEAGYDISDEDFDTLMAMREAAEGGIMDSIAKAIDKIIEAFKKFYHEMKLKVLSKIVKSEFKYAVEQIKKRIKLNPFFARKKIKIANTEKQSGVIAWFQAELAKILAKLRSGKNVTPEELDDLDDEYKKRFDAASKISNAVNTTVSNASEIASKAADKISDSIDRAFKFTNDHLKAAKDVASGAASEVASRARRVASMLSSAGKDMINVLINAVLDVVASIRSAASKLTGKEKDVEDVKEESVFTDDELDSMASEILEHSYDVDDMIASIEADIFGESGMDFDDEEESSYFEDTLDD